MSIKNPLLLAQSILGGLQVANAGSALEGVGLPHSYTVLIAALIGAVQLSVATYQHGQSNPTAAGVASAAAAADTAAAAPPVPTTPPAPAVVPATANPLTVTDPGVHPATLPQVNPTGSSG